MRSSTVAIDASCLLNLLATGREAAIVEALDWELLTSDQALEEVHHLSSPPDDEGHRATVPVDLTSLKETGRFTLCALDDTWLDAFVACAEHLQDKDAYYVALAGARGVPLVTDDEKEKKVFVTVRARSGQARSRLPSGSPASISS